MNRLSIVLPNLSGGGAERVAVNLANGFSRRGYAVDMVLLAAAGEFLSDLRPEICVVDLKVKRQRWALPALVRYLRHARPAAMLACMWPLTVSALCARAVAGIPTRTVVAEHTTWSRSALLKRWSVGWQARTTMHHFFPVADGVVAVSHGAADDLARFANLSRSAISVIYNPVVGEDCSTAAPKPLAPLAWWSGMHKKVLAVGTLKPEKDYRTLLDAFAHLLLRVDAKLLILGEGGCRGALEAQARQLGIGGRLFLPGFVRDPSPYYQQADLHVLSSTGEGLANVLIEALAAGTPVVSTDCLSGPREILSDGQFGRLVSVGNVEGLASAMEQSLLERHDATALIARAQDFTIDRAVDRYEELLFNPKLIVC